MSGKANCKRIVLTGASGVGKTSLATVLAEKLQCRLIPELARVICQEKGAKRIGDIPEQEQFKFEVLHRQIEAENESDQFVADRGCIDAWVLWQRWNICQAMTYDTERFYDQARAQAQKYTHIIHLPPLFTPAEDEFRWTEPDYIKQVERIFQMTLYDLNLLDRTLIIATSKFDERVDAVLTWLESK